MRLLMLSQIASLLIRGTCAPNKPVLGYCVDSRNIKPGEIFFALEGENLNGHDFLDEVRRKGAVAAVVSRKYEGPSGDFFLIHVEDPLEALQRLAKLVLADSSSRVIAITGSVGKTTTKEFVHTLLTDSYLTTASPGNNNSQIGLPLSILNHTSGKEEVVILEMGMTHFGQIAKLIEIAPPEVSLLTSVELVHACNFDSIEEIAKSKAEIFQHPQTKLAILHRNIPNYYQITQGISCDKQSFSLTSGDADYGVDPSGSSHLFSRLEKHLIQIDSFSLPGNHNRHNLLAAIAIARYFKVGWEEIWQRLPLLSLPKRRLEHLQHNGIHFVNDAYNASEISVKAALESLPEPEKGGKKIAVLGGMMELGKFADECHRRVAEHALNLVDECYCFGRECQPIFDTWKKAGKPVELFDDFTDLVECLKISLKACDVVLLKGSYCKGMWRILEYYAEGIRK